MNIITPTVNEKGLIYYGDCGLNVKRIFGVDPGAFLTMHEDLVSKGLRVITTDASTQVDFVFNCHALMVSEANIELLLREYNDAQRGDFTELRHSLSLAQIYYHYNADGHDVQIQRTEKGVSTPDLIVDGIKCELKVRHDQTRNRMEPYRQLQLDRNDDEYLDKLIKQTRSMSEDLDAAISRVIEGFHQADCVILDLSNHFHSWNYRRLKSLNDEGAIDGLSSNTVPPLVRKCILFSPDNAHDLSRVGFNPRAYWGYLPIDSELIKGTSDTD